MLVSMTSFPCEESRMTTWDVFITLFYHVDERSCPCTMRINPTGSPIDCHKSKKA
jgi:hypothetical protein